MRRPITRITVGLAEGDGVRRRADILAVEEPLEIRVGGTPLAVTMRTPGNDVELAAGFLVSEGVISDAAQFRSAIHCTGPGIEENTYNVLDVTLMPGTVLPESSLQRNFYTTSSCGVCGKASIEAVETVSSFDVSQDSVQIDAETVVGLPDQLRSHQEVFDKTGGLHAAGLFDAVTGECLVIREDVGRHNAVDKVIGWAVLGERLPLRGTILQVSGRASFELVQKAVMAGIPVLSAISAPSSLAVELAATSGVTLVGFLRDSRMNVYSRPDRMRLGGVEVSTQ